MPDPEGLPDLRGLFFMDKPPRYFSYLLRLWQTDDQGQPVWRASLECPGAGQRQGFADLQELLDFLRTLTDLGACSSQDTRQAQHAPVHNFSARTH